MHRGPAQLYFLSHRSDAPPRSRFNLFDMNVSKFFLVGLLLLGLQTADAQDRRPRPDGDRDVMRALNLTPEQQQQITQLREDHHAAMRQTRTATFETEDARRDAARTLRKQHRADINAVLTPEQRTKMRELHRGRRELRRNELEQRRNDPARKARRDAADAYRAQHIEPVLKQQRAKLRVDPADVPELNRLRTAWAQRKTEQRARRRSDARGRGERPAPHNREATRANFEAMRTLVKKYEPQIKVLMEEIEPQRAQWKQDLQQIMGEDARSERPHRGGAEPTPEQREKRMRGMGAAKFLLLDPNE